MNRIVSFLSIGVLVVFCGTALAIRSFNTPEDDRSEHPQNGLQKEGEGFGAKVEGLRIKLQFDAPLHGLAARTFVLAIENVGDTDLNVQLGRSLGNGKNYFPSELGLVAWEGKNMLQLSYETPRVAGRMDPFVVPLPAGSTFTLRCELEKFVLKESRKSIELSTKDYRIVAELVGQPVKQTNVDLHGLTLMKYWEGTAKSNEAHLKHDLR